MIRTKSNQKNTYNETTSFIASQERKKRDTPLALHLLPVKMP